MKTSHTTTTRHPRRWMWGSVAALAIGGTSLLTLHGVTAARPLQPAAASASTTVSTVAAPVAFSARGRGGPGRGGPMGGREMGGGGPLLRGGRAGLTVTAVNPSAQTITASTRGRQAVTITVSATTAFTEAQTAATLGDVTVGEHIAVRGTRTGTATFAATAVEIILPRESGVVTAENTATTPSTLTMTDFNGATATVHLTGNTHYQEAGKAVTVSDVTVASAVTVAGTRNSDGSLTAVHVVIRLPRVGGQVTGISNGQYTISSRDGTTKTVVTTSNTSYVGPRGASVAAASIVRGSLMMAEGMLSADGQTLTAQRIMVIPAPQGLLGLMGGPGFGRHNGGYGMMGGTGLGLGGPLGPAPSQTTTPSAPTGGV